MMGVKQKPLCLIGAVLAGFLTADGSKALLSMVYGLLKVRVWRKLKHIWNLCGSFCWKHRFGGGGWWVLFPGSSLEYRSLQRWHLCPCKVDGADGVAIAQSIWLKGVATA